MCTTESMYFIQCGGMSTQKMKELIKELLSFGNGLLVITILASVLSFYFSYFIGFDAVDDIRKITQAQFASALADSVRNHLVTTATTVHNTEIAIRQGYFTKMDGLQALIEYMNHCYEVYAVANLIGVVSFYLGNDFNNYVGYTSDPASAMVQFAGVVEDYHSLLVIDLDTGAFNTTHMDDAAVYVFEYSTLDWEPYYKARDTGKALWSDLYAFDDNMDYVYLTYAQPVNYPNGSFCCVLFVDLTVHAISEYLVTLPVVVQAKGLAMILDIDLSFIASTDQTQYPLTYNSSSPNLGDKIMGVDVTNPELAAGARYYEGNYEGKHQNMTAQIHTETGTYFFQSSTIHEPNGNKTWILITMQPRSYYFSKIDKMQLLIVIFSVVSVTTGALYRIVPFIRQWKRFREIAAGVGVGVSVSAMTPLPSIHELEMTASAKLGVRTNLSGDRGLKAERSNFDIAEYSGSSN